MMKRLAAILSALALLCSQASAGFLINSFQVAPPPVLTFLQCSTTAPTGTNPYTFSSQNTGTAASNRYTIIAINTEDSATVFDVTGVTVGGNAATEVADYAGAASLASSAIYIIANPSNSSDNVVVTMSEAITNSSVCLWSVTGLSSATATDTATGGSSNNSSISLNIDLADNGVGVAGCDATVDSNAFTWTDFTERADAAHSSAAGRTTAADYTATAAETNKTVSANATGTDQSGCAAATFR